MLTYESFANAILIDTVPITARLNPEVDSLPVFYYGEGALMEKYEVVYISDARKWVLRKEGSTHAIRKLPTRDDAIDFCEKHFEKRTVRNPASVKFKRKDGTIFDENTYPRGADPRRSRG